MLRTLVRRLLAAASVTTVMGTMTLAALPSASAAVAQLPFTITNNSGRADATYVYVIARNSSGTQGYVDCGGTWRAYSFPSSIPNGPVAAPDVSIPGPANGTSKTITLPPSLAGGRIYLSMGAKLSFFLTTNGLVEPAPWIATDPNAERALRLDRVRPREQWRQRHLHQHARPSTCSASR